MKDGWVKPAKNRRLTPSPSSENGEQSYFFKNIFNFSLSFKLKAMKSCLNRDDKTESQS